MPQRKNNAYFICMTPEETPSPTPRALKIVIPPICFMFDNNLKLLKPDCSHF